MGKVPHFEVTQRKENRDRLMKPSESQKDKHVVRMSNSPPVIHFIRPPEIKALTLGMLSWL